MLGGEKTYGEKRIEPFETLADIVIMNRWKNAIQNIEAKILKKNT